MGTQRVPTEPTSPRAVLQGLSGWCSLPACRSGRFACYRNVRNHRVFGLRSGDGECGSACVFLWRSTPTTVGTSSLLQLLVCASCNWCGGRHRTRMIRTVRRGGRLVGAVGAPGVNGRWIEQLTASFSLPCVAVSAVQRCRACGARSRPAQNVACRYMCLCIYTCANVCVGGGSHEWADRS